MGPSRPVVTVAVSMAGPRIERATPSLVRYARTGTGHRPGGAVGPRASARTGEEPRGGAGLILSLRVAKLRTPPARPLDDGVLSLGRARAPARGPAPPPPLSPSPGRRCLGCCCAVVENAAEGRETE